MTDGPQWPRGGEWPWLWEVYVVGLAGAAMVAVILLDQRYPGNVIGRYRRAVGHGACALIFGRRVTPLPENGWRALLSLARSWLCGSWRCGVTGRGRRGARDLSACVLDFYAARRVGGDDDVNIIPLALLLLSNGFGHRISAWPSRSRSSGGGTAGDRHGDHHIDAATQTAGRTGRRAGGHPRRERPLVA